MADLQQPTASTSWVYSIRTSMANDPAKHWFDTQVQSHGFDFLDDYLSNILTQAKPQPIIELVKTPSRKKNLSKKPRSILASASKLKSVVSLSLDDDDDQSKENMAPVNTFHQALIKVKANSVEPTGSPSANSNSLKGKERATSLDPEYQQVIEYAAHEQTRSHALEVPEVRSQPNDLSIIAEGDELADGSGRLAASAVRPETPPPPVDDEPQHMEETPAKPPSPPVSEAPEEPHEMETQSVEEPIVQPQSTAAHIEVETQSMTAPLPSQQLPARTPFKTTIPLHEIPGTGLMRKASAPQLHAVPTMPNLNTAPPSQPLPKRTSWLIKAKEAREAKVAEANAKRVSTLPQGTVHNDRASLAVPSDSRAKRKSADVLDPLEYTRQSKMLKMVEDDVQSNAVRESSSDVNEPIPMMMSEDDDGGTFHFKRFKGKSTGKSLGGNAAIALAEARATAEARIAEKAKLESAVAESPTVPAQELEPEPAAVEEAVQKSLHRSRDSEKRLSVSELILTRDSLPSAKERVFQPPVSDVPPSRPTSDIGTNSANTEDVPMATDPASPPPKSRQSKPSLSLLSKPVFMKPPPKVFVPPPQTKAPSPKMAGTNVGLSPSFQKPTAPLSAQSSAASLKSDSIFDRENAAPSWMPATQDTDIDYETRTQDQEMRGMNEVEDDDSWHDGDKLGELNHIWTLGTFEPTDKEDEMTWSTIPTQTQTSSTQNQTNSSKLLSSQAKPPVVESPKEPEEDVEDAAVDEAREVDMDIDTDMDEIELEPGQMTVGLVTKTSSDDRVSYHSIESSESSQGGIFHQATKFMNSVLGSSKKGKGTPDPVKSIQLAAAVARKQKEEEDKKVAKAKEMDLKRAQKKAEDENTRALEADKKAKEEADRRKKEREENTDKKPLKASTAKKVIEEPPKKRKAEPEPKAAPSSQESQPARITRATANNAPKSILKLPGEASSNHPAPKAPIAGPSEPKSSKAITIATPAKGKGKAAAKDDEAQPSRIVKGIKASEKRARMLPEPAVKSESIQLPEIDSEYSDSDDEDRKKNFNPPDWAQSPNLHSTLHALSTVNPDQIFGAVQPLHIEDMFKNRQSRFRARTSSANWSGNDGLTPQEEEDYARRMGFI